MIPSRITSVRARLRAPSPRDEEEEPATTATTGNARIQRGWRRQRRLCIAHPGRLEKTPECAIERLPQQEQSDECHEQVELLAGLERTTGPGGDQEHEDEDQERTHAARPLRYRSPCARQRFPHLAPFGRLLAQ